MDFFDSLVLPQSSEHIALLQYILMMIYFIFLPFSGLIITGTLMSLFYKRKENKSGDSTFSKFSKDLIQVVTINKSAGVVFGIIPAFSLILIYTQLLHSSGTYIISFLFFSFILYSAGVVLIYIYRYTMIFDEVFSAALPKLEGDIVNEEYKNIAAGSENLKNKTGIYGLIMGITAILFIMGCISLSVFTSRWNQVHNVFNLVFSFDVLFRFLFYLSSSFSLLGCFLLFINLYWDGGRKGLKENEKEMILNISLKLIFIFSILQPLFLFLSLYTLPDVAISSAIVAAVVIAVILVLFILILSFVLAKENVIKYSGFILVLNICVFSISIIKDQLALGNSTSVHTLALNAEYEKYISNYKTSAGMDDMAVNGEAIYKKICSTCHRFDQKLVGPPYKETLPKYEGQIDKLAAFIENPVKINQNYPAMPNQGLKPEEAKAVAKYILGNYKK